MMDLAKKINDLHLLKDDLEDNDFPAILMIEKYKKAVMLLIEITDLLYERVTYEN